MKFFFYLLFSFIIIKPLFSEDDKKYVNYPFTAKELEDGEAFLKANQDIFVKLRTGKVLSAEERYNATLFSMAYTYASYIQGG